MSPEEFWSFVRGTRPRPPPGPRKPLASLFLVAASFAHLPLVYLLVRDVTLAPPVAIAVGLIAMGLAWCGGVALEGRRPGTTRLVAATAVLEGALAFAPPIEASLGSARFGFVAIAAFAACGLLLLRRPAATSSAASRG